MNLKIGDKVHLKENHLTAHGIIISPKAIGIIIEKEVLSVVSYRICFLIHFEACGIIFPMRFNVGEDFFEKIQDLK